MVAFELELELERLTKHLVNGEKSSTWELKTVQRKCAAYDRHRGCFWIKRLNKFLVVNCTRATG